jgi:hypothetical protein
MKLHDKLDFNSLVGLHTIIYGETNTGKTFYTAKFIQYLIEIKGFNPKEITILDFAPKLAYIKNLKIGGRIYDYYENSVKCNNIDFEGEIIPPRLNAKDKSDLFKIICLNFKKIYEILKIYNKNPTPVLIINDVSLYSHLGANQYLINTINKSNTFFGNAYYGDSIRNKFSKLLSIREKGRIDSLVRNIDQSFKTS